MSITEYERNHLFMWFEENMGKDIANTMMSLLPPVGWADVATKRDLDILDAKIDHVAERLDAKIDHVAERLDAKIDRVAERLDAKIDRLDAKIDQVAGRIDGVEARMATKEDLNELRSDLQRTFVTWMFATQGAVVAAIGVLLAVIR